LGGEGGRAATSFGGPAGPAFVSPVACRPSCRSRRSAAEIDSTLAEPSNAGAGHRFGFALTTGDIDGDGITDWVDTSPGDAYYLLGAVSQSAGRLLCLLLVVSTGGRKGLRAADSSLR
jgi:hypothetical protein